MQTTRELPETINALESLSWNYWWSWAADGASVFRDLDPGLWETCEHNPRRLLLETEDFRLIRMATDPAYIRRVERLAKSFNDYISEDASTWARNGAKEITHANPVAYFCAEFGIHQSLPLYSGGLGMLAGDHLKSASDLGLPLIGVGLLYNHGYFRQRLRRDGWQEESYQQINPRELPIRLVHDESSGDDNNHQTLPLRVGVMVRGRNVSAQVWRVQVGRVPLYLLDTNIAENNPIDRMITGHLYGGDRETRCVQEMVLGIGGVRLLRQLGIEPHVFHLNEGHSAFLTLELTREQTVANKPFAAAAEDVRRRCVFTTHTPVSAGHDEFVKSLVEMCFGEGYWQQLGLTREEFLDLGRVTIGNEEELFGLTPLALRMCRSTNGVSRIHGRVSRALWMKMYPGQTASEVPITHITNGVHAPTWVAPLLRSIYERYVGQDWADAVHDPARWAKSIDAIPDVELWRARCLLKQRLIAFVRHRLYHSRLQQGEGVDYAVAARTMFDPDALTIGFARRVAAYKRWSLILTDPNRLMRLVEDEGRPVQFIFAGKAHPQDQGAKLILQHLAQWKLDPRVMTRAVFLQDYDQEIARQLVQSVDVWLNVPRRPLEASGTSGEKVAMNGGLNLSVLDGWWPEGFDSTNGWAIGPELHEGESHEEDADDAESLYHTLETEVVPTYYSHDGTDPVPHRWVAMMKRAIITLAPAFNSDRMVQEYTRKIYVGE
ncbi:MAG: alpha-glucan family phosphorylase [Acidobacteriota bacterium]|nr:alpha-glucan family phosphorylase [Acidobacteriota bacterium]